MNTPKKSCRSPGEAEIVRTRHRDWCLRLVEEAVDGMDGAGQQYWWDRLEAEHDNLRAALNWSGRDQNNPGALLLLAAGLGRFWQTRGYVREGITWLEAALARNNPSANRTRVRALDWLAICQAWAGHADYARSLLEECVAEARSISDWRLLATALRHLGGQVRALGDPTQAHALIEEALHVARKSGGKREIAWSLMALAKALPRRASWIKVSSCCLNVWRSDGSPGIFLSSSLACAISAVSTPRTGIWPPRTAQSPKHYCRRGESSSQSSSRAFC